MCSRVLPTSSMQNQFHKLICMHSSITQINIIRLDLSIMCDSITSLSSQGEISVNYVQLRFIYIYIIVNGATEVSNGISIIAWPHNISLALHLRHMYDGGGER